MINMFFSKEYLFIKKDEEILKYELEDIELLLEDILIDLDISNKDKICICLDIYNKELSYYTKLFSSYNLNLAVIYLLEELMVDKYKELIYIYDNRYIYITEDKIEVLDFDKEDNIDLDGIKLIDINNIEEIFSLFIDTKAKNHLKRKYIKREYILIALVIFVAINYYLSFKIFNTDKISKKSLEVEEQIKRNTIKLDELKLKIENGKKEEVEEGFLDKLEKYRGKDDLERILNLSKKYFYFYSININSDETRLEGVCKNLSSITENIKSYEILDMKKYKDYLYFDIKFLNRGDSDD